MMKHWGCAIRATGIGVPGKLKFLYKEAAKACQEVFAQILNKNAKSRRREGAANMRKRLVLLAALTVLISVSSCLVFDYLFKTKCQALGEALVKSSGKELEKQETAQQPEVPYQRGRERQQGMHLHERHRSLRRHGRDRRPDRPYRGRCREDEDLRILPRLHQSAASLCLIAQTLATE